MSNEQSQTKQLKESLLINNKNAGVILADAEIAKADEFCEPYKSFLNTAKTERLAVEYSIEKLKQAGFAEFDKTKKYQAGDKVYSNNRGKAIIAAVIGKESLENGVKILASHIDSPRLDLKPCPLYEEAQLAMFKTHYYGGIKKYQWTALPLALYGTIIKANGEKVNVSLGDGENDPVFCVTDLLPHLATDQMKRSSPDLIKGEELNILVGSRSYKDDELTEKVKLYIIKLLNEKYGISEHDFLSAELEAVPAIPSKDVGFDKSFVGGYGQDDRVCAYTTLMATIQAQTPNQTIVTVLADKEETGSDGNTGLKSAFLRYFIADLAMPHGIEGRTVLSNSKCFSADVTSAFDPTFAEVNDKRNTSYVNYGVAVMKYTGSRGKAGTSDCSAEFVAYVRNLFQKNNIVWQSGELGKVDQGGGGTVAAYIANLNVDVIDVGVPVLSMHSPFEVTAKLDVYMAYKAFCAFCNE